MDGRGPERLEEGGGTREVITTSSKWTGYRFGWFLLLTNKKGRNRVIVNVFSGSDVGVDVSEKMFILLIEFLVNVRFLLINVQLETKT